MRSAETRHVATTPQSANLQATNWPLRDDPFRTGAVLTICVVVGVVISFLSSSWFMGFFSTMALAASIWKLWLPITCEIGGNGITLSVLRWRRRIVWHDIDHLEALGRGITICAEPDRSPLSALRHLYLPWRGDTAAVVELSIQYRPHIDARGSTATWDGRQLDQQRVL